MTKMQIVYFSNYSKNTHRFVEKLNLKKAPIQIPIKWDNEHPIFCKEPYVLIVPTYGGGSESHAVPRSVIKFLNIKENRDQLKGIIGMGNTNFGRHYCRAAEIIAMKTGAPIIYKVELLGTLDDVNEVNERIENI